MAAKYKRAPEASNLVNHEDRRRGVLRRHAKPSSKIFVDGVNFVVVVRLEENVADENAREDGADCQLQIGVAAERESLTRGSEESCRSLSPRR